MSHSKAAKSSCCFICKSSEDDELLYGKFFTKWRFRVHYYCLLLTSNLIQNGETDEVGLFGFLQQDVRVEEARIRNQKCYICKERFANISCCAKKCFRTFHTVCGIQRGCLSHFVDTFQSWCDKHVELKDPVQHTETDACGICYDALGPYNKLESIHAPCCQNGWFHRRCVAHFAQTAGYFFKCPLCNNKDDFIRAIQQRGVYIPEKDAAWELEPNAFGEQLERPSQCDAEECLCRFGREHDSRKWDLILCATCGSTCRHDQCMEQPSKNYVCTFCRPIVGDEPPAAVLALAEASRRAEASRQRNTASSSDEEDHRHNGTRYESGIHSPGSSNGSSGRSRQRTRSASSDSRSTDSSEINIPVRGKQKKRRIQSTDSNAESPVIGKKKRKSGHKRSVVRSDVSDSGSDVGFSRKTCGTHRRLSSTSSHSSLSSQGYNASRLRKMVKIPLHMESFDKLFNGKPIVKLQKLSAEQIKAMTSSENEDASSTTSSVLFDFNYRVKLNKKQRRKSMGDLLSIKDVIRSDTDTLTDASVGREFIRAKTPSHKSFSKQFSLKLLGSKSTARKRIGSTSESDPEHPPKKSCSSLDQPLPTSKSRMSLFQTSDNTENTCPNSPLKAPVEPIIEHCRPSPIKLKPFESLISPASLPPKTVSAKENGLTGSSTSGNVSGGSSSKSGHHQQHQTTLSSFFKKPSPSSDEMGGSAGFSSSGNSSAISSTGNKSAKKSAGKTPGGTRKKLVELDRSQRNLLDYFNRC